MSATVTIDHDLPWITPRVDSRWTAAGRSSMTASSPCSICRASPTDGSLVGSAPAVRYVAAHPQGRGDPLPGAQEAWRLCPEVRGHRRDPAGKRDARPDPRRVRRAAAVRGPLYGLREGDLGKGSALQPPLVQGGLAVLVTRSTARRPRSAQGGVDHDHRHRRDPSGRWADGCGSSAGPPQLPAVGKGPTRVAEPRALYRANRRFKKRMRWVKRQAYNDGRAALRAAGFPSKPLPPVLVCVSSCRNEGRFTRTWRSATQPRLSGSSLGVVHRLAQEVDSPLRARLRSGLEASQQSAAFGSDRAASYLCKYLTKDHPPWLLKTLKGPVVTVPRPGNRPINVTPLLRKTRRLWAARDGRCDYPTWDWETAVKVGYLLDARTVAAQGP